MPAPRIAFFAALSLFFGLSLSAACGSDEAPQGGDGGDDTSSTTHATTSATTTSSSGITCDSGFSSSCCFGDGVCCPCAAHGCDPTSSHESQIVLTNCLCESDVCAKECQSACVGLGIDVSCFVCAAKETADSCADQYGACGGQPSSCGAPAGCSECVSCANSGACYDTWHACWFDEECQAVMLCAGDGSLASLQGCLPEHPNAAPLLDAYLNCAYCSTCSSLCPDESASYCGVD